MDRHKNTHRVTQTQTTGLSLNAALTARSNGSSVGLPQLFLATQPFSKQSDPGLQDCTISEFTLNAGSQTPWKADGEEVMEPVGVLMAVRLHAREDM